MLRTGVLRCALRSTASAIDTPLVVRVRPCDVELPRAEDIAAAGMRMKDLTPLATGERQVLQDAMLEPPFRPVASPVDLLMQDGFAPARARRTAGTALQNAILGDDFGWARIAGSDATMVDMPRAAGRRAGRAVGNTLMGDFFAPGASAEQSVMEREFDFLPTAARTAGDAVLRDVLGEEFGTATCSLVEHEAEGAAAVAELCDLVMGDVHMTPRAPTCDTLDDNSAPARRATRAEPARSAEEIAMLLMY